MNTIHQIVSGLLHKYKSRVPAVDTILSSLVEDDIIKDKDDIKNDHIAFRTLGVKHLGIASFEKIFLAHGYTPMDEYVFEAKKLDARWYAPPSPELPRVFISELRVHDLSEEAQKIIHRYTGNITSDPINSIDLTNAKEVDTFLHSALWEVPSYEEYKNLLQESEYAAWVIYNRYYLNHFTITINELPTPYNAIENFNSYVQKLDVKLNTSGGIIKTSKDGLLLQSSTVSEPCSATFKNGTIKDIAGSYVEFAQRKVLPEFAHLKPSEIKDHHRREGFEAANADKIFESTYTSQMNTDKH